MASSSPQAPPPLLLLLPSVTLCLLLLLASPRGAAAALGVAGMTPAEADAMVREGDADGDGALSEAEFCVLMVRLSPGIMADAEAWLEEAIAEELARGEEPDAGGSGTAAPAPASRRSV